MTLGEGGSATNDGDPSVPLTVKIDAVLIIRAVVGVVPNTPTPPPIKPRQAELRFAARHLLVVEVVADDSVDYKKYDKNQRSDGTDSKECRCDDVRNGQSSNRSKAD